MGSLNASGIPPVQKHQVVRHQGHSVVLSDSRGDDVVAEKTQLSSVKTFEQLEASILAIPSRTIWLDADNADTITEVGGLVTEWRDRTNNGKYADDSFPSSIAPVYQPGILNIGGRRRAALKFSGDRNCLSMGTQLDDMFTAGRSHTMYLVFQVTRYSAPFTTALINKTDNAAAWTFLINIYKDSSTNPEVETTYYANVGGTIYAYFSHNANQNILVNTNYMLGLEYNATTAGTGGINRFNQRTNGVLDVLARTSSGGGLGNLAARGDPLTIGSLATNDDFHGYVMEFLAFNETLSVQEKTTVENYLGMKWGVETPQIRLGAS